MGVFFERELMSDAEWLDFIQQTMGSEIEQLNRELAALRHELKAKNDSLLAVQLSSKRKRTSYLPKPTGKIGAGSASDWCHAITDKAYVARALAEEMLKVDTSLAASIEDKIFALESSAFKNWATCVAELISLCISWLDYRGVGEVARASLFLEINQRLKGD